MQNKKIIFLFFMLIPAFSYASERETLISNSTGHSGGFGGPVLKATQIDGKSIGLMGGKGAWLIDHKYYMGGGGFGTLNDLNDQGDKMSYGGLILGVIGQSNKLFNYSFEILIGGGGVNRDGAYENNNTSHMHSNAHDNFFVIEPAALVSLNLSSHANINFGVSYRYINGSNQPTLTDSKLSGISAQLGVMFGRF